MKLGQRSDRGKGRAAGLATGLRILLFLLPSVGFVPIASADSAVINGIPYSGIRILGVKEDELQFETSGGTATSKSLSVVSRISVSDEPALNMAEDAFAKEDWERAAENYEKTMRSITSPNKAWLRDWCSARLVTAAGKGGRFDISVRAFIEVARKSPEQAGKMFSGLKIPKAGSDYLKQAASSLESEAASTKSDATAQVLLSALKDIYTANNDTARAAQTATKLVEVAARLNPNSPESIRALMDLKLQNLRKALEARQYGTVIDTILKEQNNISDPAQQVDALFLLAEAKAGKAAGSPDADWKDIAVGYVRVIANAKADDPHVPVALLRVAAIHAERLDEKATAQRLYSDIVKQYKDSEAAKEAQKALAGMK